MAITYHNFNPRIALSLALLIFSLPSLKQVDAGLVVQDFASAGDEGVTFDTDTNLRWLDLSYTVNQSPNTINARLALTGDLVGWRFATAVEVATFYSSAGIPSIGSTSTGDGPFVQGRTSANLTAVNSLMDKWGSLSSFGLIARQSQPIVADTTPSGQQYIGELNVFTDGTAAADPLVSFANNHIRGPARAGALVQSAAAVPEPSAFALLALFGACGMTFHSRHRNQATNR